jgi:hypothetical protein
MADEDVKNDKRFLYLLNGPEDKHKTGPDPFHHTVVFTRSILALVLTNLIVFVKNHNWEVTASADGTHGVSISDYKLIPFGVLGVYHNSRGSMQFSPIAYGFGEGEREVVVLITFLSIKLAAEKLFGINNIQFKGGFCSDHSSSFVNAFKEVLPTTQPIQCYSHIIRKFIDPLQSNRKENGTYRRHLQNSRFNQQFFIYNEAMKDGVSNLHD